MSGVENRAENGKGVQPRVVQILPGVFVFEGLERDPNIVARVRAKDRDIRRRIIEARTPRNEPTS